MVTSLQHRSSLIPLPNQQRHNVPFQPWDEFLGRTFRWSQGEHVITIGPTGEGKTTLIENLMPMRKYIVVLATKPKDKTMDSLIKTGGFTVFTEWPKMRPWTAPLPDRIVLWPRRGSMDGDRAAMQDSFSRFFDHAYSDGGYTIVIDEVQYMVDELRLEQKVKTLHHQARSMNVTILEGTQRPSWIPVIAYSSATHMFLFNTPDENDLRRLKGFGGANARLVQQVILNLRKHEMLYVNTRRRILVRTKMGR